MSSRASTDDRVRETVQPDAGHRRARDLRRRVLRRSRGEAAEPRTDRGAQSRAVRRQRGDGPGSSATRGSHCSTSGRSPTTSRSPSRRDQRAGLRDAVLDEGGLRARRDLPVTVLAAERSEAERAIAGLRSVAVDQILGFVLGGGDEVTGTVPLDELDELIADGATVIDVREKDERDAGYIPGSRNIPYRLMGLCCPDLPSDRPIVTICGGGPRAAIAASILRAKGLDARPVVGGGMNDWLARGETDGQLQALRLARARRQSPAPSSSSRSRAVAPSPREQLARPGELASPRRPRHRRRGAHGLRGRASRPRAAARRSPASVSAASSKRPRRRRARPRGSATPGLVERCRARPCRPIRSRRAPRTSSSTRDEAAGFARRRSRSSSSELAGLDVTRSGQASRPRPANDGKTTWSSPRSRASSTRRARRRRPRRPRPSRTSPSSPSTKRYSGSW